MALASSRRVEQTREPAAPWDDEELPHPASPLWTFLARHRRPLVRVAVPVLVLGAGWRLAHLDVAPTPSAAPVTTTSRTPTPDTGVTVRTVAPAARDGSVFSDAGDVCPPTKSCRTSTARPIGALFALRAQYPQADVSAVRTITLNTDTGPRLWSRSLTAHLSGRREVTVQVSSIGRQLGSGQLGTGKDVLVYIERRNGPYIVRVAVAGPAPHLDSVLRPAGRLASDPRVVALS